MSINTDSQIYSIYEVDRLSCGEWGSIEHLFVGSIWFGGWKVWGGGGKYGKLK
jgi:hypothetical protein